MRTLRGERVDRIPIMPFDTFEALKLMQGSELVFATGEKLNDFTSGWKTRDTRYREVVDFACEKGCDVVHRTSFPQLDRRFFLISPDHIETEQKWVNENILHRIHRVKTPEGTLNYIEELKKDFSTTWVRKPLLESKTDVKKILAVPYHFHKPDVNDFIKIREELGQEGVICCFVSTPLVCVSHMFSFERFLMWCVSEKTLIQELVETVYERIYRQLEYLLQNGVGPLIEFGGSEQATPPMMSPQLYDNLVVKYDRKLMDLVHQHGCMVRVHCHGRIRTILKKLLEMGVDMLNPVESPPSGDIELHQAKEIVKGKMTLEGNIQFSDLEFGSREKIDHLVRDAVLKGPKCHFLLTATEWPLTFLSQRLKDNYIQFIESGLKYGKIQS